MTTVTGEDAAAERRTLHRAHRHIEPLLRQIETVAEMAGNLADPALDHTLQGLLDSLALTLLPHFDWENEILIPAIDAQAGAPAAGHLLRLQHAQIRQALARLAAGRAALRREPTYRQLADLRARLYGLHALLCAHLEQEEDVIRPVLRATITAETLVEVP
jgi:iron-sulfur cluster repair protein YtfE (RIC family)